MALPLILTALVGRITSMVIKPGTLTALAQRFGYKSLTQNGLVTLIKTNKIAAAWAAYEIFGIGDPDVQKLISEDPEIASQLMLLSNENDDANDSDTMGEISNYEDEFLALNEAISKFGGFENFIAVRRALTMPDSTISLYLSVQKVANTVRF